MTEPIVKPKNEDLRRFLNVCATMKETDFHKNFVRPFLKAIGATSLEYTHGSNERGKDFLYVIETAYGKKELHACVVKNGEFNGRANDSNSVQTSLVQIQTAKTSECLNPVTHKMETPKRVIVIATHQFPDKHAGNLGTQMDRISDFCDFLMAEDFALKFHKQCPTQFAETVSPGSIIGKTHIQRLQLHSEANLFRLPRGQDFKTFVDMRMLTQVPQLLQLIEEGNRPKNVDAEHIETSLVEFLKIYHEFMTKYVNLPELVSFTPIVQASKSSQDKNSKVRVKTLRIGDLFDMICDLHRQVVKPKGGNNLADLLFSTHSILALLLSNFRFVESKAQFPELKFGIIGAFLDATKDLAFSKDNLYIVGEPGGGKTFTLQELAKLLHEAGSQVVYFPCSKIDALKSLKESIEEHVQETAQCTRDEAVSYVAASETVLIDGLDEAITLGEGLIKELIELANVKSPSITLNFDPTYKLDILPHSIREKLILTRRGKKTRLEVKLGLHWDEANIVASLLFKKEAEITKAVKSLSKARRLIVTCRQALSIDLGDSFRKLQLLQFSDEELEQFVRSHCEAANHGPDELLSFFRTHGYIHDVCKSPLTASIMLGIYLRGSRLPTSLADLYERRANLLMQEWDFARKVKRVTGGTESQKIRLASRFAFEMHLRRKVEATKSQLISFGKAEFGGTVELPILRQMIEDLVKHHGILCMVGDLLSFGHLSHLEFFCARYIMQRQKMSLLVKNFGRPRWQNVILFFVGLSNATNELLEKVQAAGKLISDDLLVKRLIAEGQASEGFGSFLLDEIEASQGDDEFEYDHLDEFHEDFS
ncbi:MAG: ATP-binding protein [Pirellulaceae bacterium]|nr:ATP-binding protein [Pirellulaceae bacterium]